MRFTEVLRHILNKIIRQNPKKQPEDYQKITEVSVAGREKKEIVPNEKTNEKHGWGEGECWCNPEKEKMIRRYRAYAFHHKKRRIRKKYMKKLLELTIGYRLYHAKHKNVSLIPMWMGERIAGVDYSTQKDFSPGYTGSRKLDHQDSRMEGGVR